jgi:hypothetical protein
VSIVKSSKENSAKTIGGRFHPQLPPAGQSGTPELLHSGQRSTCHLNITDSHSVGWHILMFLIEGNQQAQSPKLRERAPQVRLDHPAHDSGIYNDVADHAFVKNAQCAKMPKC